jgi:hypothetical protein
MSRTRHIVGPRAFSATTAVLVALLPLPAARADVVGTAPGLTLVPAAQSATKGAIVSLSVQRDGGPGPQQISYVVVGRNDGVHGSVDTGSAGKATISYRDGGTSADTTDTIAVIDAADDLSATATVDYLDGPDYADRVVVDTSGAGIDDAGCAAGRGTPATGVALARDTAVCALVTNDLGEPLAGKPVAFAVSTGAIGPAEVAPGTGTTYLTTTDRAGVAFASVTATSPGAQQVSATVDHLTSGASVGYAAPAPDDAAGIVVTPPTARLTAGVAQQFVATVHDGFGNPVAGVEVGFGMTGPGSLAATTSLPIATGADGTVAATVTTRRGHTGTGTVVASILTAPSRCGLPSAGSTGPVGACSATASFTVSRPVAPASLTLEAAPGATVGLVELIGAVVMRSDGSPAVGQTVHFGVSGSDVGSGAVRTNSKGVALFGYRADRAGVDTVRAFDDTDRDGRHQRSEPAGSVRVTVAPPPKERPTIALSSPRIGQIQVRVTSRPRLVGATVALEELRPGGVRRRPVRLQTDRRGVVAYSFVARPGAFVMLRARVSGQAGIAAGYSRWRSARVARG